MIRAIKSDLRALKRIISRNKKLSLLIGGGSLLATGGYFVISDTSSLGTIASFKSKKHTLIIQSIEFEPLKPSGEEWDKSGSGLAETVCNLLSGLLTSDASPPDPQIFIGVTNTGEDILLNSKYLMVDGDLNKLKIDLTPPVLLPNIDFGSEEINIKAYDIDCSQTPELIGSVILDSSEIPSLDKETTIQGTGGIKSITLKNSSMNSDGIEFQYCEKLLSEGIIPLYQGNISEDNPYFQRFIRIASPEGSVTRALSQGAYNNLPSLVEFNRKSIPYDLFMSCVTEAREAKATPFNDIMQCTINAQFTPSNNRYGGCYTPSSDCTTPILPDCRDLQNQGN